MEFGGQVLGMAVTTRHSYSRKKDSKAATLLQTFIFLGVWGGARELTCSLEFQMED